VADRFETLSGDRMNRDGVKSLDGDSERALRLLAKSTRGGRKEDSLLACRLLGEGLDLVQGDAVGEADFESWDSGTGDRLNRSFLRISAAWCSFSMRFLWK